MRSHTLEDLELIALEKQYWDAIKDKDIATTMRLSDDTCMIVGAQGIGELDKRTLAELVETAPYRLTKYSFDEADIHVRRVSDDVAVIAYKVREDLSIDGKSSSMEAFDASVWVRRAGGWVCALHTETVHGDPYGRDDLEIDEFARLSAEGLKR